MKVKAFFTDGNFGFYGNVRRYDGDVFDIEDDAHFSPVWMINLDDDNEDDEQDDQEQTEKKAKTGKKSKRGRKPKEEQQEEIEFKNEEHEIDDDVGF